MTSQHNLSSNMYLAEIKALFLKIESTHLFKNFNLSLPIGRRVGITGPSGCGKTTLLRSIITGHPPNGSRYEKFSVSLNENISRIGYIPQSPSLLPWYSLRRNIHYFLPSEISETQTTKYINRIVKALDLSDCIDNFPDMLSGGEMQRALLACSILSKPNLFLADEPLTEVDLEKKWRILDFWSNEMVNLSSALILISHDVDILTYLCDEIIVLSGNPAEETHRFFIITSHPRDKNDIVNGDPQIARTELLNVLFGESMR